MKALRVKIVGPNGKILQVTDPIKKNLYKDLEANNNRLRTVQIYTGKDSKK